jgi:hypothetical protein
VPQLGHAGTWGGGDPEDSSNPPSTLGLVFFDRATDVADQAVVSRSSKRVQLLSLDTSGVDAAQWGSPKERQDVSVRQSDISKGGEVNLTEVGHELV